MNRLAKTDVKYLTGVGESRARLLKSEMQVSTMADLLYTFPSRHVDRSRFYSIAEFQADMALVQVRGSFIKFAMEGEGAKKRLTALFTDGKMVMEVLWFNRPDSMRSLYSVGTEYVLFGKPSLYKGTWSMVHPEIENYNPDNPPHGFYGVYTLSEKIKKRGFSNRLMRKLLRNLLDSGVFRQSGETLPAFLIERHRLMPLKEALENIHFPTSMQHLARARERLKYEELFFTEVHILRYSQQRNRQVRGHLFPRVGPVFNNFYKECLPFPLTGAQKKVVREIHADMVSGRQMNRLLQGDVGSGKTLVAFMSMLLAVDNGFQACLMAPTEILATQHFETLSGWCRQLGINVALLKGSTSQKERKVIHEGLRSGSLNILIGTHALIEEDVVFSNLGIAVIDEQHRFGVAQRAKLWKKNTTPAHILVMTATPIPRTLAMTVYGDLDVSVIDELPPGRKPVRTVLRYENDRESVYTGLWHQLRQGRQAYIVYPLIHENDKLDLKSLEEGLRAVREVFDAKVGIAYVHGQMKPDEKKHQMDLFVNGDAKILVATTVIEVGVNVPNATVMVINNAERFGLAQLHQLRGRVGRGADCSYCILISKPQIGGDTRKRLQLMTETTDGFAIAEADMKMRGPGDVEGTLQSGLAFSFQIANLAKDGDMITVARREALEVLDMYPALSGQQDPNAGSPVVMSINDELQRRFGKNVNWSRIS